MHLNTKNKNLKSFKVYIIGINKYTVTTCNEDFRKQKTQNNLMLQFHKNSPEMGKCIIYRKTSNNLNPETWISLKISSYTYSIHRPPSSKSFAERKHKYEEKHSSIQQPQCNAFFDSWTSWQQCLQNIKKKKFKFCSAQPLW